MKFTNAKVSTLALSYTPQTDDTIHSKRWNNATFRADVNKPIILPPKRQKTIDSESIFERTLCHGTLPVSSIHQNTPFFIFCITTRPKLLTNDCAKINEGTLLSILIFHCLQLECPYALISKRFSADYYTSILRNSNKYINLIVTKKSAFFFNSTS